MSAQPPQQQSQQPGVESQMTPKPQSQPETHELGGGLRGKVVLITGGDSGIGRAVALAFARSGSDVAIVYLNEHDDANETAKQVQQYGTRAITIAGDVSDVQFCRNAVDQTVRELGRLDVVVNNAAVQWPQDDLSKITPEQLDRTFKTNIYAQFYLSQAALPHLQPGSSILCTASINAFKGNKMLLDYSATKGAIEAFVRSLALQLAERGIRVNAVAPGPIWTPLIPASMPPDHVAEFGKETPMKRPGQPDEVAPAYVFLASDAGTYITGQTIHVNGGMIVNA